MYKMRRPDGDSSPHTGQENHSPSGTDKNEITPACDHNQAVDASALPEDWDLSFSTNGVEYTREPTCAMCFFYKECAGGAGHAAPFGRVRQLTLDGHVHNVQRIIWIGGQGECRADPFSPNERWPIVDSNSLCGKLTSPWDASGKWRRPYDAA